MTDDIKYSNENTTALGSIEISPEVLEIISGIAINEVKGVEGMYGSFSSEMTTFLGRTDHKKGVYLKASAGGNLAIDLYCYLEYGVNVPATVKEIQERVKEQVYFMTDILLEEVNVHIVDIIPEKSSAKSFDFGQAAKA